MDQNTAATSGSAIKSRTVLVSLALLLGLAFAVRIAHIKDRSLLACTGFRSYHSANIARAYYYRMLPAAAVPAWRRQMAELNFKKTWHMEPPFLEALTAGFYFVTGGEKLWIPRLLCALFWVSGGLFVFLICRGFVSPAVALSCTGIYLFLPFGILATCTFQPDSLMVMLCLAGIYGILCYFREPSLRRLMAATAASASAVLIKPMGAILLVFVFLGQYSYSWKQNAISSKARLVSPAIFFGGLLAGFGYYFYLFAKGTPDLHYKFSWQTEFLVSGDFFQFWIERIQEIFGVNIVAAAFLGVFLAKGRWKWFLVSSWLSYAVFCRIFVFQAATHSYYSLPYVPIAAISLAEVFRFFEKHLLRIPSKAVRGSLVAVLAAAVFRWSAGGLQHFSELQYFIFFFPKSKEEVYIKTVKMIGRTFGHTERNMLIDTAQHAEAFRYYAEMDCARWPNLVDLKYFKPYIPNLSPSERFKRIMASNPRYFIVLDKEELKNQKELNQILRTGFPVLMEAENFVIFDLKPPAKAAA